MDNHGRTDEVIRISSEALKHAPEDANILFIRANAFGKLDRFSEAERLYQKAITNQPNFALSHLNLGVLYHRWNKFDKAVESYRNALKFNPSLPNARKYLEQLMRKPTKVKL